MSTPYDAPARRIGVIVVTTGPVPSVEGAYVLRLEPALHDHPPGQECIACAAAGDIRALLFDLLQQRRSGAVPDFARVVIDATGVSDPRAVVARLDAPAQGLRDHTVARSFELVRVV